VLRMNRSLTTASVVVASMEKLSNAPRKIGFPTVEMIRSPGVTRLKNEIPECWKMPYTAAVVPATTMAPSMRRLCSNVRAFPAIIRKNTMRLSVLYAE
jgi:hypothetical protein